MTVVRKLAPDGVTLKRSITRDSCLVLKNDFARLNTRQRLWFTLKLVINRQMFWCWQSVCLATAFRPKSGFKKCRCSHRVRASKRGLYQVKKASVHVFVQVIEDLVRKNVCFTYSKSQFIVLQVIETTYWTVNTFILSMLQSRGPDWNVTYETNSWNGIRMWLLVLSFFIHSSSVLSTLPGINKYG